MPINASLTSEWRKSSFSEAGNCVEVAAYDDSVLIRDTVRRGGELLSFSTSAWQDFIHVLRNN